MKRTLVTSLLLAASVVSVGAAGSDVGDPVSGETVFKRCASCHMVGDNVRNRVGPPLNNLISAKAGSVADFNYSAAMNKAASEGLHWTEETLNAFLENPKSFLPKTKMSFRGLKSEADRRDVIAFLAKFSGGSMAAMVDDGFKVSDDVLAIVGDIEYGEYLSSECTTCHRVDGDNDGIPAIIGWQTEDFVTALHAYKEKQRDNQVMQTITARLSDEEIAALAAYFQQLEP